VYHLRRCSHEGGTSVPRPLALYYSSTISRARFLSVVMRPSLLRLPEKRLTVHAYLDSAVFVLPTQGRSLPSNVLLLLSGIHAMTTPVAPLLQKVM
jgi:hypothetical protein